jgi:acid stress-induced BolA-like protein IbaG/YrbA
MLYGRAMSSHPTSFQGSITDAIRTAIEEKIEGCTVEVIGGGGHYEITATSAVFAGKGTLDRQRLIYSAITHLMAGDLAPVHAVDKITTKTP